jgi:hypothetical protein
MDRYTGPDEFPIKEIPDTPQWSENFAAMFANPATRVAAYYSIGRWHSDPTIWRESIMVSLPDQRVLFSRGYGRNGTSTGPGGSLSRYEILEPGNKMRLTFDGPMSEAACQDLIDNGVRMGTMQRCKLDLRFDSAAPVWNMKGDSVEAAKMAGSMHIDHIGKVNGTIDYGGKTYTFTDGYGIRDHSRGVRDVSQYGGHNWLNGIFPGGRAFYVYAMKSQGSSTLGMSNAAVAQGDRLYPARLLHTEFISSTKDAGRTHKFVLGSELGEMEIEFAEVLNIFPAAMVSPYDVCAGSIKHRKAAFMLDEAVRMKWDGKEGFGWSERGFASEPL